MSVPATFDELRSGGKPALARALALLERDPFSPEAAELLDQAARAPRGPLIGLTGPPGVGKSSLIDRLLTGLRARGRTVAVLAVDPSSTKSGGALLGDRARLSSLDPLDAGVFVRSLASRGHLGGLAELVFPAALVMQALYDIVLVETVGVGQSETEVAGLTDLTVLCVQPASGDSLQFLKAGIMEVPDIAVVTKGDLGEPARRAASEFQSAIAVTGSAANLHVVSAMTGEGIEDLIDSIWDRGEFLNLQAARQEQIATWLAAISLARFGVIGVKYLQQPQGVAGPSSSFRVFADWSRRTEERLDSLD